MSTSTPVNMKSLLMLLMHEAKKVVECEVERDIQPGFLNDSTPKLGVSTQRFPGTPSLFLRSKKLLHSITTSVHSASARPVYFAHAFASPRGSLGCMSALLLLSELEDFVSVYMLSIVPGGDKDACDDGRDAFSSI